MFRRYPSEGDVARRLLCLAALVTRASAGAAIRADANRDEASRFVADLERWVEDERLTRHQSREERAFFARRPDDASQHEQTQMSWRTESAGVLKWSLSQLDAIPPYDEQVEDVLVDLPIGEPITDFVGSCRLRPRDELKKARDVAELWHWRARTLELQKDPPPDLELPEGWSLGPIVSETAATAHRANDIPPPIAGDFPAFGKAYRDLTPDEQAEALSIAMERHFALNWVCGYSRDWDTTPTDT